MRNILDINRYSKIIEFLLYLKLGVVTVTSREEYSKIYQPMYKKYSASIMLCS